MKVVAFYTYYVSYVLIQYFTNTQPAVLTEAYRHNYECAKRVVEALPEEEQRILKDVYTSNTPTIPNDKVVATALKYGRTPIAVWTLIKRVQHRLAEERGLI